MSLKDYKAECGCIIEMNITHDWESGATEAEDISIITACEKHRPTPLAPDAATLCPECGEPFDFCAMGHYNRQ